MLLTLVKTNNDHLSFRFWYFNLLKYYAINVNGNMVLCSYSHRNKLNWFPITEYENLDKYWRFKFHGCQYECQFINSYCSGLFFSDIL